MKKLIQGILVFWFLAINAAILIPSYLLMFGAGVVDNFVRMKHYSPPQALTLL